MNFIQGLVLVVGEAGNLPRQSHVFCCAAVLCSLRQNGRFGKCGQVNREEKPSIFPNPLRHGGVSGASTHLIKGNTMSPNNNTFTPVAAQKHEARIWSRTNNVMQHTCFPFDEGLVDQDLVGMRIQRICESFGYPKATPYVQAIILLEWRSRFLDGYTEMFQNAEGEVTLVDLDDELTPVCGMAYEYCAALPGDAVSLHQINDDGAPALAQILGVLHAEGGLPQGDSDYGAMAQSVRAMLVEIVKAESAPVTNWTPLVKRKACTFDDLENLLIDAAAYAFLGAVASASAHTTSK